MRKSTSFTVMLLVLTLFAGSVTAQESLPVAEPEPQEYLQACVAYGSGYLKIAGTETCLKADGYLRSDYVIRDSDEGDGSGSFRYRARVNLHAKNETEYGTLYSLLRVQADEVLGASRSNIKVNRALIQLAGFRTGYTQPYFVTNHRQGWHKAANDGFYSDSRTMLLDYTWQSGGFATTLGIQDSIGENETLGQGPGNPQFYWGGSYKTSWGRLAASLGHDGMTDGTAAKISVELYPVDGLELHGWYSRDFGGTRFIFGNYSASAQSGINTEWEWGIDADYQLTEKLLVWAGLTNADNPSGAPEADLLKGGVGFRYRLGPRMTVRPEVIFSKDYTEYRFRVQKAF